MTSRGEHLPVVPRIGYFSAAVIAGGAFIGLGAGSFDDAISFNEGSWVPETDEMASYDDGQPGFFVQGLSVSFAEGILEDSNEALTDTEQRLEDAQQSVPDVCMKLLDNYIDGGVLETTHIDGVVSDMLNTDGQPCGEQPTDIRIVVSPLAEADDEIDDAEAFNEEAVRYLEFQRDAQEADDEVDLRNFGSVVGLVVGGLVGWYTEPPTVDALRRYQHKRYLKRVTRP